MGFTLRGVELHHIINIHILYYVLTEVGTRLRPGFTRSEEASCREIGKIILRGTSTKKILLY